MANDEITDDERFEQFRESLDRVCKAHNVYLQAGASTMIVWTTDRDHPLNGRQLGHIDSAGYA